MFIEVLIVWKHISKLHQISFLSNNRVGECIDGSKYFKETYLEFLTTGMARPLPNGGNFINVANKNDDEK